MIVPGAQSRMAEPCRLNNPNRTFVRAWCGETRPVGRSNSLDPEIIIKSLIRHASTQIDESILVFVDPTGISNTSVSQWTMHPSNWFADPNERISVGRAHRATLRALHRPTKDIWLQLRWLQWAQFKNTIRPKTYRFPHPPQYPCQIDCISVRLEGRRPQTV